jgi:hypothetical protein
MTRRPPEMVRALAGLGEARLGERRPEDALALASRAMRIVSEKDGFSNSDEAVMARALLARLKR